MITEEICDSKKPISELCENVVVYPQYTKNVRVYNKANAVEDMAVLAAVAEAETEIAGEGRVLLRESGTEPVVRIMVEAKTADDCLRHAENIAKVLKERGHIVE